MAWWIFQSLVTTAALAAVVAIVCRFGRIGPVARHALWVIVLLKFIAPPVVVWPWAAPDPLGLARFDREEVTEAVPVAGVTEVSLRPAEDVSQAALPEMSAAAISAPAPREAGGKYSLQMSTVFVALWIAGSICLLAVEGIRLLRQARRVALALPADPAIERRVATLSAQLGVPPVPVLTMPGATSPVVWCLGRPKLLWPAELGEQSDACIDGLIVHELAHVGRRDHIVGWMELVAGVAWWWNPLFWSVRRALREQAELACDAWVISTLPNGRRAYAESLLALSSLGPAPAASIAAVVGVRASSRRVLERRLVMIMKGRAPLRLPWAGLAALVVVASATLPAWASGNITEDAQQPAPAVVAQQPPAAVPVVAQQPTPAPQVKPAPAQARPVVREEKVAAPARPVKTAPQAHDVPVVVHKEVTAHVQERPQATRKVTVARPTPQHRATFTFLPSTTELTPEGQKLIEKFTIQRETIQKELDARIESERQAVIKELQALQDQYAKAGKLDEAVAIRDYLKAGGPVDPGKGTWFIRR